jgi:hypothetical protein
MGSLSARRVAINREGPVHQLPRALFTTFCLFAHFMFKNIFVFAQVFFSIYYLSASLICATFVYRPKKGALLPLKPKACAWNGALWYPLPSSSA